ncbi:MAG: M56 family metallopeptidase [Rhodanobacter sp.]
MNAIDTFADTLFVRLAWTSAQATLLIGALWLLGRWMPRLSPAIRCMLWWVLGVQLLVGLTASTPVALPLLSPTSNAVAIATTVSHPMTSATPLAKSQVPSEFTTQTSTSSETVATQIATVPITANATHWRSIVILLWLAGLIVQMLLAIRQWRETRDVLRDSTPLQDETLHALCAQQAYAFGLRYCPHLRVSHAIASPQVAGLWRPTVLLPASHALTPEESSMALAHELAHLRRGDLWLGWVPAIAQRLFFFHPLVAWAMREYALNREVACDAKAVHQRHAAPQDYGRLLLRLGVAHPMHAGLAGASPTFQNLKRRLIMLQQTVNDTTPRARGWLLVLLVALAGVLPYRVTAADTKQVQDTAQTSDYAVPPAPPAPPVPAVPPAPPAPLAPPAPPAPPAPLAHNLGFIHARYVDIDTQSNASRGFALFDGDTVMINGSDSDLADVQRMHKTSEPVLWFRRGDKAYVIHDNSFIQRAKSTYAPISELAEMQGRLAGKQGELAGQEGGLAARSGELAGQQAELESQRAVIASQRAELTVEPTNSANSTERSAALVQQTHGLDARTKDIAQQQAELSREQSVLSKQQSVLSKQQAELSRHQREVSEKANRQMDQLLDEALAKGVAQAASAH